MIAMISAATGVAMTQSAISFMIFVFYSKKAKDRKRQLHCLPRPGQGWTSLDECANIAVNLNKSNLMGQQNLSAAEATFGRCTVLLDEILFILALALLLAWLREDQVTRFQWSPTMASRHIRRPLSLWLGTQKIASYQSMRTAYRDLSR